ncbi:MAG: DUF4082 domain-containing protein [Acidobacteriota bacterium]
MLRLFGLLAAFVAISVVTPNWSPTTAQSSDPCLPPIGNPIMCENQLPGNPSSEWDISGSGDDSIQGFATEISVNRGQTVSFKIDTNSTAYRLDIYRMGFYNGMGARKVATVSPTVTLPQNQPNCLTDSVTGLIDCGNWVVSAQWAVPSTATSGIYFAKAISQTSGEASHIVFIVRNDASTSDLLFQTSDTTWQAYNQYGGNSLYAGGPGINPSRAYKVSYNRPFTTRGTAPEDWVFNAEYPMVRWLEANGYDVSYLAGVDPDRLGTTPFLNAQSQKKHQVFLSVGHDEYWSGKQRTSVESARNAGMDLAFFSGNEVFWKTRWENSIAPGATPYRTLVSYKETHANAKIDPAANVWTGTWQDPRFSPPSDGGRPQNALTGTLFSVNCCSDAITVPAADGKMRFWRTTTVAAQAAGAVATLPDGTLGYEWDSDVDNGFRPSGLFRLSDTTVSQPSVLLDYGSTYGFGTAQHSLTLYKHSSGALVFGAGTVQWSWGLDSAHDRGANAPSLAMQQATLNLFADMGVQPLTAQAGLVTQSASVDTVAPTSVITSPANGGGVPANTTTTISGTASDAGGGRVGGVEVSIDGGATWRRASGRENWSFLWQTGAARPVTLFTRAVDDSGNISQAGSGVSVTVGVGSVTCPCSIWAPSQGPSGGVDADGSQLELGTKFRSDVAGFITAIRYFKAGQDTGAHIGNLWSASGTKLATITFGGETSSGWQEQRLASPVAISANTTYVVSYHTNTGFYYGSDGFFANGVDNGPLHGLEDGLAEPNGVYRYGVSAFPNESFNSENYWADVVFVTTVVPDTTPPLVSSVVPAGGSTSAAATTSVAATFNEAMTASSVTAASFEVRNSANALVAGSVTYSAADRTVTFQPSSGLGFSATYSARVRGGSSGVKDSSGNAMTADYLWSFTTSAPPPPPPTSGPGGPILVISSTVNPFAQYYAEILRAEGLNEFSVTDITQITATVLGNYDVAILGDLPLTAAQATMLSTWVTGGGNLIAMRPDKKLASLLGLTDAASTLADTYLQVNTATAPGAGIVSSTMQFHGTADRYTLSGATAIATLFSNASTATANPAVTVRSVGSAGGLAAAFTYDLARSVIYTRQGNPAWSGQDRDGQAPVRSDDLFFGGAQPNYVDLAKVAIPQADEQQRLLANLIGFVNAHRKPLPRFWYLPRGLKAVIVMTGDDHANNGTAGRFNIYEANSTPGCNVANWDCIRGTSYMFAHTPISSSLVASYIAKGFEISAHMWSSGEADGLSDQQNSCHDYTAQSLNADFSQQLAQFATLFPSTAPARTNRTHCIVWSDYDSQPLASQANGIRLDTNYYYWPDVWVNDVPGVFTGSAMPMRFAKKDGTMIDVYQAATQMTDESAQSFPATPDTLLDRALGPEGYYGAYVANMHTDTAEHVGSASIVASAQARGVPVISARQLLDWVDGRNGSSFGGMTWDGSTLAFSVTQGAGALNLQTMLPSSFGGHPMTQLLANGAPLTYSIQVVKGVSYAVFTSVAGQYQAKYTVDTTTPLISGVSATPTASAASVTWTTDEAASSRVDFGTSATDLSGTTTVSGVVMSHSVQLIGLAPSTTYYYRVTSADVSGNSSTTPTAPAAATFTTGAAPNLNCPCSVWSPADVPAVATVSDPDAIEVGMKFRSTYDGFITAIRFFKGTQNLGPHVGHLWSKSGTLLGTATFTNETGSGWQVASLAAPVAVSANTTYVVSYHTASGFYSANSAYFQSAGVTNGPLTALANAADGPNGLYQYGAGGFPTDTFNTSNYWVDVVFDVSVDQSSPTVTAVAPAANATAVAIAAPVTGTFSEAINESTLNATTFELRDAASTLVPAAVSYSAATRTATLQPNAALAYSTVYTARLKGGAAGIKDTTGNPIPADVVWSFTTAAPPTYDCPCTIWSPGTVPVQPAVNDHDAVEVGVKFRAMFDGFITGVRFYKSAQNSGPHVANLWNRDGTLLSTATFVDETASGWQQVKLPTPVRVLANTTYVASYHTTTGSYAADGAYFQTSPSGSGPVQALANGTDGGNGVFAYGAGGFPTGTFNSANYWVDVMFETTATDPLNTLADKTAADFAAGAGDAGIFVTETTDGELVLTPAFATEFSGSALTSGWSATPWNDGSTAVVAAGRVSVDGTRVSLDNVLPPGQSLDFVATFSTDNLEHAGFALTLNENLWAIFSATGNALHARTHDGVTPTDTVIPGSWLGTPHRFRIDWGMSTVEFWIDGTQVASVPTAIAGGMRPTVSDYNVGGGAVVVDWMRLTPYAASGTFTSRVMNAGAPIAWSSVAWTAQVPDGTTLAMSARFGNTPVPDSSWTSFAALAANGGSPAVTSQYGQYRAVLSGNGSATPVVQDVSMAGANAPPTITVANVSVVEGSAGATNATFVLSLSRSTVSQVSVAYSTANGTAGAADYTATTGTAVFPPGTVSVNINVPVAADLAIEPDETFFLNLGTASNALVGTAQAIATIVNDDFPAISVNSVSVTEGNGGPVAATFAVSLSEAFTGTVTVAYATADTTATAGSDYTAAAGTLTFAPGTTTQTIAVPVLGDALDEANETFTFTLSGATNATIAAAQGIGTIVDDDATPSIVINNASVAEGDAGTTSASLVATLSAPSGQTVTVNYATANGTATSPSDYVTGSGTVTFAPGATTASIPVVVVGDTTYEADQTVLVNLSGATNATIADAQGILTITNDDLPLLTINSTSVTEGNSVSATATFTVTLTPASAQTVTVAYATANGTAASGTDYTATSGTLTFTPGLTTRTFNVTVLGDTLDEANETFVVNLSNPVNGAIATAQGTGTIVDNDSAPSLSIGNVSVTEGNTGTKTASLAVTLSTASGQTVTVNYATANGSATAGSDYVAAAGTLTFAPGVTSQPVVVTINGDVLSETDETVLVNLSGAANAGISDSQGVLTIANDEPPQLNIDNDSVTEGTFFGVTATFTVSLTSASTQTVTVAYATANGTATAGSDYTAASGTLTFTPGTTSRTINVSVLTDTLDEANETFFVNLSNPVNVTIGTAQGIGTIVDSDSAPSLSIGNVSITEGNTGTKTGSLAVTLSTASGQAVTVNYTTANGSATAGTDYVAAAGTLTFAPGVTSQPVVVTINGDALGESDETVLVNLSGATNAGISDSQGILTITNDDPLPAITIGDVSITEGNSGTKIVTATLTLSPASTQTVTVNYATANGTASSFSDYASKSGTVTFNPGTTTGSITVTINGDNSRESNETFLVNLSSPAGATLARTSATVTILNDD